MPNTGPDRHASSAVHVAVAVIRRVSLEGQQQILIAKRPQSAHQGGLWEFPGGKLEPEETVEDALARELAEELNMQIPQSANRPPEPLIRIAHDYGDKQVLLDVWQVFEFSGQVRGNEGQAVRWVDIDQLADYSFPAANKPIITACGLPSQLVITPEYASLQQALADLQRLQTEGARLVLFRQPQLASETYLSWSKAVIDCFTRDKLQLMLSGDPGELDHLGAWGVHMPARIAQAYTKQDLPECSGQLSSSCHSLAECQHALCLGLDFVTLSPVLATASHPGAHPLGWEIFETWTDTLAIPVFALGGLDPSQLKRAQRAGAQGIAGIRAWQA